MEKFLVKDLIGEFFSKMYQENRGKQMEITLKIDKDIIQIWNRDTDVSNAFTDIPLIDEAPTIDGLIKSLSE